MGMVFTTVLAVVIFGFGLSAFFRAIKKEAVDGICSSCGPDKNCCNKKIVKFEQLEDSK